MKIFSEIGGRRLSQEGGLKVWLEPGSLDVQPEDLIIGNVTVNQAVRETLIYIVFDNPMTVSAGSDPDILKIQFTDKELFQTTEGKFVEADLELEQKLPP